MEGLNTQDIAYAKATSKYPSTSFDRPHPSVTNQGGLCYHSRSNKSNLKNFGTGHSSFQEPDTPDIRQETLISPNGRTPWQSDNGVVFGGR